jgi:hypothetical protein
VRQWSAAGRLPDMRRSGGVGADVGGAWSRINRYKLANTVDTNQRLRLVYSPVSFASVRRFDEARAIGAKLLEQNRSKSTPISSLGILLGSWTPAKPLK